MVRRWPLNVRRVPKAEAALVQARAEAKVTLHRPVEPVVSGGRPVAAAKAPVRPRCIGRRGGRVDPSPIGVQAMRTEFGRPNSSMRLRT